MTAYRILLATPLLIALVFLAAQLQAGSAAPGDIERVSVSSNEVQGTGTDNEDAAISADGRFVAFASGALGLVPNDTNDSFDAFVRDRQNGTTERVSVDSNRDQIEGHSGGVAISDDGRFVAFTTNANGVVPGDNESLSDVFVHDRQTHETEIVSVDSNGVRGDASSSGPPALSADGRFVAFYSNAANLVENDNNGVMDAFVHDRQTGVTERVSVDSNETEGDLNTFDVSISNDGRYVAFDTSSALAPDDGNDKADVYVRDRQAGTTERVSVDTSGDDANDSSFAAHLSADGRFVVFESRATDLVSGNDANGAEEDIYVRDRQTGATTRASVATNGAQGSADSSHSGISGDGRYVVFGTSSSLAQEDDNAFEDVYVHDTQTGTTRLISYDTTGDDGNGDSWGSESDSTLTQDGHLATFISDASDLVPGDSNNIRDVFVRDLSEPTPTPSPSPTPSLSPTPSPTPSESPSPTESPPPNPTQGDVDCDGDVDQDDFTFVLQYAAGLNDGTTAGPCLDLGDPESNSGFPWGDVNCDEAVDAVDGLYLVAHLADVALVPEAGNCFAIGNQMT